MYNKKNKCNSKQAHKTSKSVIIMEMQVIRDAGSIY